MRKFVNLYIMVIIGCLLFAGQVYSSSHGQQGMGGDGCLYCGMNLEKFAHSAVKITYNDDTVTNECSIHCAAINLSLNIDKTPMKIEVGDFNSKEKINAEEAFWVIDDNNPGVMTSRAKWAFAKMEEAEAFIAAKGGRIATFEEVIEASYMDMYKDTKMIRKKRQMMKGQKM